MTNLNKGILTPPIKGFFTCQCNDVIQGVYLTSGVIKTYRDKRFRKRGDKYK